MKKPDRVGSGRARTSIVIGILVLVATVGRPHPGPAFAQEPTQPVSLTDTIPDAALGEMIEAGSSVFNGGSCIICHAVGGRGDDRRGPDLSDAEWLHSDGGFEGVLQTIMWGVRKEDMKAVTPRPFQMNPSGGMPLASRDRLAVAAYVWSLSHGRQPPHVIAQGEFLRLLEGSEVDEAVALFERERGPGSDSPLFDERAINLLGYEFLQQKSRPRIAIEIFQLNAELYPNSWNAWDSLAEGHMAAGNRERAIELYEKSLELNPENENAREKLLQLRNN